MAWRQMTVDSEAGPYQVWIDDQTGQTSTTNPALAGAGLGYTNEMRQGPDGAMIDTQLVNSIGGVSPNQFQTRVKADGRLETLNPTTGQWEKTYRAPFDMAGGNQFVPESIGKPIGGAFIEFNKPAENKGGFFEDYALPAIIGGITTAGLGSMLGAGSLFGGAASGSGGLSGAGAADWMESAFTPGFGTLGASGAGAAGLGLTEAELAAAGSGLGSGIEGAAIAAGPVAAGAGLAGLGAAGVGPFGTAAGTAATTAATQSALSKILNGTANSDDYLGLFGKVAPGLISAFGSNQQANALSDLAKEQSAFGAPSRARFEASMTPGFDPTSIPGYSGAVDTAANALQRKLSTQGNPFGNPGGQIEANKQIIAGTALPAIQNYQNMNAQAGGFGSINAAAPSTAASAIGANNNVYSDVGSAFGALTNKQPTIDDILKNLSNKNVTLNTGSGLA